MAQLGYREFIKKGLEADRKEKELKQLIDHRKSLVNEWLTYAAHPSTGLVYDTRILEHNIDRLKKDLEILVAELDGKDVE